MRSNPKIRRIAALDVRQLSMLPYPGMSSTKYMTVLSAGSATTSMGLPSCMHGLNRQ